MLYDDHDDDDDADGVGDDAHRESMSREMQGGEHHPHAFQKVDFRVSTLLGCIHSSVGPSELRFKKVLYLSGFYSEAQDPFPSSYMYTYGNFVYTGVH